MSDGYKGYRQFLKRLGCEAERALRNCAILRQISHETKTYQGFPIFAILASVIETCRLRGRSPWCYLEAVITAGRGGLQWHSFK